MSNGTDAFRLDGMVWNGNVTVQARSQDLCRGGSNKRVQKFLAAMPTLINHTYKIANKTAAIFNAFGTGWSAGAARRVRDGDRIKSRRCNSYKKPSWTNL